MGAACLPDFAAALPSSLALAASALPCRRLLHLAAGAAALPVVSHIARAQAYPTRPVRFIVPFPASGPSDVLARIIHDGMRWMRPMM